MAAGKTTKANKKTTKESADKTTAAVSLAARVDRESLGEKIRVHVLAKMVGVASKELLAHLEARGLKKVASSNLTKQEAVELLDALSGTAEEKPKKKATKKVAKKAALRERVRKNVDNEITQIEDKVDAELESSVAEPVEEKKPARRAAKATAKASAAVEESGDEKLRERVRKNVDNEIAQIEDKVEAELNHEVVENQDLGTINVEQLHEALVESGDDFEDEYGAPLVAPIPDDEDHDAFEFAPIFMAPTPQKSAQEGEAKKETKRRSVRQKAEEPEQIEEPKAIRGSTRIEAQRRRRQELREKGRERKHIVSQAEFLARRESVERTMVVREKQRKDGAGVVTQVGVLEDDLLVEHFVTSESQSSMIGNIYLGRVQNVLPSMEAAFIDIGQGRNGVLYAGEVDWRQAGLGGRSRKIEHALKSGDQVLVQVAKDPIGHKGARLTTQISLAGRYLVYVPGGRSAGISRKLPVPERKRLKDILERVVPEDGGAIIRTAAENVPEEAIARDVNRLHNLWEDINATAEKEKRSKGAKPVTLYEEPDLLVKVVRDLFNEDFSQLIVDGRRSFNTVDHYVQSVAPDLADRVVRFDRSEHDGQDAFAVYRVDEQLHKALSRKVWLPSGGTLIIERTEAMTVIDVNTGKFTGSGGNLEETVTRNNLEAAEEIVRQMRLRDLGGMIVVDFIDMVLPENQDLVLRRLKEALGRDRTRHQVSEVTSLGLVQMTRKRLGTGLVETFATECEACHGRGLIIHEYPVDEEDPKDTPRGGKRSKQKPQEEREEKAEPQPSLEDLADSVLGISSEPAEQEDSTERKPRRRRGSRGASRGRATSSAEEIAEIAYAAADNAEASDDVAEFSSYVPDKTYEEAVAEFEASPRRKRRTRGNSRSDHAPRKEDFVHEVGQEQADKVESTRRTRGRRRAVRKLTPVAQEQVQVTTEEKPARRSRKRAVKRSMRQAGSGAQVKPEVEKAANDDMPKVATRGRRRAARRSTS